ncbi:methyl-accepting chemotaxis protein, partial [Thauera aromatica]|nr:methyl-accepting chemotaxis protein [Thauera aromatica]
TTQQNASASEELSATAEEMSAQAAQLQQLVGQFRLEESAPRPRRGWQALADAGQLRPDAGRMG